MHFLLAHLSTLLYALGTLASGAGGSSDISSYFQNLFDTGIKPVAYAVAVFFFGWGAIELMFPNERNQERGKLALYRAVGGLALVLLTMAITTIFQNAAGASGK